MKPKWIVATLVVTALLAVGLAGTGWVLGRTIWGGTVQAQGPWGWCGGGSGGASRGLGPGGMMRGWGIPFNGPRAAPGTNAGQTVTIQQAKEAAVNNVTSLGYSNLQVGEVMEFEQNFYAIVEESDTGIGAMELLIDKYSGAVRPEYGPNMMWNAKYGMMRGMMGGGPSGQMTITPEQARQIAQRWLNTYRPGETPEAGADAFHGYYTLHTLRDGKIVGMLSVHGGTGQVWYHTWHGAFIQMIGGEEK